LRWRAQQSAASSAVAKQPRWSERVAEEEAVVLAEEEEEACLATAEILATNGRDFEVALCVTPL
tara:strand:+ start:198 stop:389 length:192 start_codon:yes stop_codon:yes gene_type:complete